MTFSLLPCNPEPIAEQSAPIWSMPTFNAKARQWTAVGVIPLAILKTSCALLNDLKGRLIPGYLTAGFGRCFSLDCHHGEAECAVKRATTGDTLTVVEWMRRRPNVRATSSAKLYRSGRGDGRPLPRLSSKTSG